MHSPRQSQYKEVFQAFLFPKEHTIFVSFSLLYSLIINLLSNRLIKQNVIRNSHLKWQQRKRTNQTPCISVWQSLIKQKCDNFCSQGSLLNVEGLPISFLICFWRSWWMPNSPFVSNPSFKSPSYLLYTLLYTLYITHKSEL